MNYLFDKLPEKDQNVIKEVIKLGAQELISYCRKLEMELELAEMCGREDDLREIERNLTIVNTIINIQTLLN